MKFPPVINQQVNTDKSCTFSLMITPELDAFEGHFDNFPIVPGVVQIQWALHFFSHYMAQSNSSHRWQVDRLSAIKFQQVITPELSVNLELHFDEQKQLLQFKITSSEHQHSSGKLLLKAVED
ncbi:ApeI family dehydratase [Kangiella sediminilitoris]|uniref:AMP-binding enzyme family protein n=1 Tax=Kangiella sediminilitoris TaxID=1144748 RepID=A0A1B3BE45_9GAMM|nr:AMP-binding protein [Kangiella sediminilitoris]AOE50977.1 AMP-binding enzyme family protein [Kangiella sediminilitoris]